MVDVYLLPANEGDCLWVRYGKKEGTRHNIIIDGGVESNGGDIASIIENIAERNEKVDIFVTHIDGDHIRGLIKGIGISNAEVLKKCVDTIYFNNKKDILDKFRIDSISSEGLEESIKTYIPSGKGYSISEAVSLLEILKKKEIDDKIVASRKKVEAKIAALQKDAPRLRQAEIQKRQDEITKFGSDEEAVLNKLMEEQDKKVAEFQELNEKRQTEERGKLLESIQVATNNLAKAKGYTYVLDANSVVFAVDGKDITEEVLKSIPATEKAAPAKTEEKK